MPPWEVHFGWWRTPSGLRARISWRRKTGMVSVYHPINGVEDLARFETPESVQAVLVGLDPERPDDYESAIASLREQAGNVTGEGLVLQAFPRARIPP